MPNQSSAKTIVFYNDSTYFSGAERSFALLAQTSVQEGNTVELFATSAIAEQFKPFISSEQIHGNVTRSKISLSWYFSLYSYLKKTQPDIVVINMWSPYANTLMALAAKATRIPSIGIYHFYQEKSQVKGFLKPLRLLAYRLGKYMFSRVLTVSEAHRQVLINQFLFPASRVSVIPNGNPDPNFHPDFQDHEPRRLLTVGSLEPAKGYDFLLEILAEVQAPWSLTILGDGPSRPRLEQLAIKLGDRVTLAGRQRPESYYKEHDILVHPSHFENLSMAIIESMSYGLTCIANDVGGNRELIEQDKTGWLLQLGDRAGWIAALEKACTEPLATERQAAWQRWQKEFTVLNQYQAFMKEVAVTLNEASR